MEFRIIKKSKKSKARVGLIKTPNGTISTPYFFPVATQATVKTLDSSDLQAIGFDGVLCNTYHLFLRPGSALIKKHNGLHSFMNFDGVIATDSGGFQVFSLGKGLEEGIGKIVKIFPGSKTNKTKKQQNSFVKISDKGVYFRSHLDGKLFFFTPEKSIKIQEELGSDIAFAFDECSSPLDNFSYTKKAMERTHKWAIRSLNAHKNKKQALFGIVQGGEYKNLRIESAKFIGSLPFDGFGIGGSLGKTKKKMFEILDWTIPLLPQNKPRHLLGIGYLEDIKKAVKKGIDTFDCVYPTRLGRHGFAITEKKIINLKRAKYLQVKQPIDKNCQCFVCRNYSMGYLSHLIRTQEITGMRLLCFHNLWLFKNFMEKIRKEILNGKI